MGTFHFCVTFFKVLSSMWGKAKDRIDEIDRKMIDELFKVEEKITPDLSKCVIPMTLFRDCFNWKDG